MAAVTSNACEKFSSLVNEGTVTHAKPSEKIASQVWKFFNHFTAPNEISLQLQESGIELSDLGDAKDGMIYRVYYFKNWQELQYKNLLDHRASCAAGSGTPRQISSTISVSKPNLGLEKEKICSALADYVTLNHHSFLPVENTGFLSLEQTLIEIGVSRGAIRAEDVMVTRQSVWSRFLDKVTTSKATVTVLIIENKHFATFTTDLVTEHYSKIL